MYPKKWKRFIVFAIEASLRSFKPIGLNNSAIGKLTFSDPFLPHCQKLSFLPLRRPAGFLETGFFSFYLS
jgi:hypothetical protein